MVRCGVVIKRECLCESPVRRLILYETCTRLFFVATDKTDSAVRVVFGFEQPTVLIAGVSLFARISCMTEGFV